MYFRRMIIYRLYSTIVDRAFSNVTGLVSRQYADFSFILPKINKYNLFYLFNYIKLIFIYSN